MSKSSPLIEIVKWGSVIVENTRYKDAKLYPGGAEEWDWKKSDTHHDPGIGMIDIACLLLQGADIIILSTGYDGCLQVQDDTLRQLTEKEILYYVLPTPQAVSCYNNLALKNVAVGALIHSTC